MASPVIVYIRRLEKGTNTHGRRPTPKPSAWHTNGDWDNQDLYAREIYVNTAEGKAFITNDTDIFNLARDDGQHDYVSANTLALKDVFFHKITNVSNEIRLINNFIKTYFKWRGGSSIVIEVLAGETVKHLYTANGNAKPIKLACGTDYTATQDILIQLVYDNDAEIWKEIGGTTIASVVERPSYVALRVQAYCEDVDTDTYITIPDSYTGYTIVNNGTATCEIVGNKIEFTSPGTAYNIEFWDEEILIDTLALCEAPRLVSNDSFLAEMRNRWSGLGERMSIMNSVGYTTHDNSQEMYAHFYGFCRVETADYIIDVPNLIGGTIQSFLLLTL
jgi:hypothetical protein